MIMACLPDAGDKQVCCTFAGRAGDTLDVRLAAKVAAICGREHRTLRLHQDFFSDFAAHADKTVYLTDGYFGITGAHEIYLNSQARQLAPVRLTGVFGSEVLRGTSTFRPSGISSRLPTRDLQWSASACVHELNGQQMDPVSFAAFKEIPWSIFGSVAACRSQIAFRTPYLDNEIVSLAYRTPRELRGSSAVAFDVIRQNHPPLSEVPTDMGHTGVNPGWKGPVRRGFSKFTFKLDYLANDGLPHWLTRFDPVLDRLNSGTGILGLHKFLRYRRWFRRELTPYVTEAVAAACRRQSGFWDARFVESMAREHISGRKNYVQEINAVLTLDAVERLLLQ
jgi:asparagine synthase (glutamine-hydrolysing)